LDCIYSNNRGSWFDYVDHLDHDARQTLSDHWPVVIFIVLEQVVPSDLQKSMYFKYDSTYLKNPELLHQVQKPWGNPRNDSPHTALRDWDAAWRQICPLMKAKKQRRRQNALAVADQRLELAHLRAIITPNSNSKETAYLFTLEQQV
jgi:hypothetical protein